MSNLLDLFNDGRNLTISVTLADLKEFAFFAIDLYKEQQEQLTTQEEDKNLLPDSEWMTAKEVCKFLKTSTTTLWRWNKQGYLTHTIIGNQRRYQTEAVKQLKGKIVKGEIK